MDETLQLTSTSEITESSMIMVPALQIKQEESSSDSPTVAMAPISARAKTSRFYCPSSRQPSGRLPQTARTAQSECCLLV